MGEPKVEEQIKQTEDCLDADTNLQIEKLDEKTLNKIVECCQEAPRNAFIHLNQRTLHDMGFIFDESVKCNLVFDQEFLLAALAKIVEMRVNTDVQVIVHGHIFKCHLAVLQISSDYFKQLSGTNLVVLNDPDVTKIGFEKAYDWMTKQDVVPQRNSILELYLTARFLQMPELLNQLWYCFENANFFSAGDAFKLYIESVPYNTGTLQSLLLTRISRFFLPAVSTVEFLNLSPDKVFEILSSSFISVNSEMEVFMAAFRWMMFDWPARKCHSELLMKAVRFNLMPAWYILSLKSRQLNPQLGELLAIPEVQSKIDMGLSYTVTQHFMSADSPLQELLQMFDQEEREWVIDELAPHHHLYKCPNWQFLDYGLFNIYLEQIIQAGPQYCITLKANNISNLLPCCQAIVQNSKNKSET